MSSKKCRSDNIADGVLCRIKAAKNFDTDRAVADFLGVDRTTLSTWKRRDTIDYALVLAKCHDIDAEWLLRGSGKSPTYRNGEDQYYGGNRLRLPVFLSPVSAGEPTPATDGNHEHFDFQAELVPHPDESFMVRVAGDSMIGAGIRYGDYVIVDRSVEPKRGDIVVAVVDGDTTVKRLEIVEDGGTRRILLYPENENYKPIDITDRDATIQGVVQTILRRVGRALNGS